MSEKIPNPTQIPNQRLLSPATEISKPRRDQNGNQKSNQVTAFQREVIKNETIQSLTNFQGQRLLNPAKDSPSTSGIVNFNQGINQTVSQIGQNQSPNPNSTLLPGQIVQVPQIPQSQNSQDQINQGQVPVLEAAQLQNELTKVQAGLEELKLQMAQFQQSGDLQSKAPEQIEKTQKEGIKMLGKLKNWAKESKMMTGITKGTKDVVNLIKKPENAVLVAGLAAGGFVALPGILSAVGVGTIAGSVVGSFGGLGFGVAAMSTAVAQGVSAVGGSILAGGGLVASDLVRRTGNFFNNKNQRNQQSEMPPIQSNYDNNPNRAILSSNLPKVQVDKFITAQVDVSTIPFGQENSQNIQNIQPTESPNQKPILQNPQIEQSPKTIETNEKITEIKTLTEGLEKTKQPEFEEKRLGIAGKITESQEKIANLPDQNNSQLTKTSEEFQNKFKNMARILGKGEKLTGKFLKEAVTEISKMLQETDKFRNESGRFGQNTEKLVEFGMLGLLKNETENLQKNILEREKNQMIIDQTTKLGENVLNSERSSKAVKLNLQNYNEEIGGGSQTAKKLRENGFKTFRESGKYVLKYDYNLQSSEEIDQKLIENSTENATTPAAENSRIEPKNESTNEPVLEVKPAIDETVESNKTDSQKVESSVKIEPQEALPDPSLDIKIDENLEISRQSLNRVMEDGFGQKVMGILEAQKSFVTELKSILKDDDKMSPRKPLQERINGLIKNLVGQSTSQKLLNLLKGEQRSPNNLFSQKDLEDFVSEIGKIKSSDPEYRKILELASKNSVQELAREGDLAQKDINQSIKLLESEIGNPQNQKSLVFSKLENGKRQIILATSEMKTRLEGLKKAGFEITKTNVGIRVEYNPQNNQNLQVSKKLENNSQITQNPSKIIENQSDLTDSKMAEMAERN